jgi:hypothetical protein
MHGTLGNGSWRGRAAVAALHGVADTTRDARDAAFLLRSRL